MLQNGVIHFNEVIDPDPLEIFRNSPEAILPKRQAPSVERAVILKVFDTGFYLSLEILRNPNGTLARTMTGFLVVPIWLVLCKSAVGLIAGLALDLG